MSVESNNTLFLISTTKDNNIFEKDGIMGETIHYTIYIADFVYFHYLVIEVSVKSGDKYQCFILPKKFTDKFKDKPKNLMIDEFLKIVQGTDKPLIVGDPIGITIGPTEILQKDGTIKIEGSERQSHITTAGIPFKNDLYEKFLQHYC